MITKIHSLPNFIFRDQTIILAVSLCPIRPLLNFPTVFHNPFNSSKSGPMEHNIPFFFIIIHHQPVVIVSIPSCNIQSKSLPPNREEVRLSISLWAPIIIIAEIKMIPSHIILMIKVFYTQSSFLKILVQFQLRILGRKSSIQFLQIAILMISS